MVIGLVNRLHRLDKKRVPDIFRSTALEFVAKHTDILEQELNESDTIEEHIPESMKEDLNEEKEQMEEEEEQQQIQDDDEEGSKDQLEEDNDYQEKAGEDEVEQEYT
ncbi:unnamed protein product [Schistosoma curassoni]|uniref:Glutamic acid-rich protein-like n=1 Tax=Schistosoma curassoni TaxID=6186 RepID=A0A183K7E8_9TREM|nr:unnamed protein product [Schistosoma curassoni]